MQVFFCGGCRYRVTAQREWPVHKVKQALFAGGIARANKPEGIRNTPGIQKWEDLVRSMLWTPCMLPQSPVMPQNP